jgi:hypothetical protein
MNLVKILALLPIAAAPLAACGSTNSGFSDSTPSLGSPDSGTGTFADGGTGEVPAPEEFKACASRTVTGNASPVHVIIALDTSGSMCQLVTEKSVDGGAQCFSANSKWNQTKLALASFFRDPASKNSAASLMPWASLFSCDVSATPLNPADVALPDTQGVLMQALGGVNPFGGTPTHQAINAAKTYATTLQSSVPAGEKIVIALVTDGMPSPECGSSIQIAGAAAQAAGAAGFPVYVVGVGQAFTNLDGMAQAAGTNNGKAILVQNNVSTEFNAVLQNIKTKSIGCGLQLPKPEVGKEIDYTKVNLSRTANGTTETLRQSQDCSDPRGWKYLPNATAPTSIELCPALCKDVKANDTGTISVVLGCETKIAPPK